MDTVQHLPAAEFRVDTGVLQIGDDWPGYFMRGDFAVPLGALITRVLEGAEADKVMVFHDAQRLTGLAVSLCEAHFDARLRNLLVDQARTAGAAYMRRLHAEGKL